MNFFCHGQDQDPFATQLITGAASLVVIYVDAATRTTFDIDTYAAIGAQVASDRTGDDPAGSVRCSGSWLDLHPQPSRLRRRSRRVTMGAASPAASPDGLPAKRTGRATRRPPRTPQQRI